MSLIWLTIAAYLYGAIPFAYLATYVLKRKAITEEGTGNVGVINAFRVGGKGAGMVTVVGEVSKAMIAIGLAERFFPHQFYVKLLFVFASFVGTNFSIFLRGRGGRGSTLFIFSMVLLSFPAFLILILIAILGLLYALSKKNARLKRLWFWFIPGVIFLVERDWGFALFGLLVTLVIFLKGRLSQDDYVYYGYVQER